MIPMLEPAELHRLKREPHYTTGIRCLFKIFWSGTICTGRPQDAIVPAGAAGRAPCGILAESGRARRYAVVWWNHYGGLPVNEGYKQASADFPIIREC